MVCNYDGYVIGDVILFYLDNDSFNIVGRPSVHNWVQYHSEIGRYDVKLERDERAAARTGPVVRKAYRFQVQGPNALKLVSKVIGTRAPDLKFFNMTKRPSPDIACARCDMAWRGSRASNCSVPGPRAKTSGEALIEAGEEFGLRLVGARAYSSNTLESGWIPSPLPRLYRRKMRATAQWLPALPMRHRFPRWSYLSPKHRGLLPDALRPGYGRSSNSTTISSAARR